jgi:transcriptional regulator with XRE-family HTH domain
MSMKSTKELLGARIKELRRSKGLSQVRLAEMVGIESKHLSRIEVGRSYPSLKTLESIARALKVEMKDLFDYVHQSSSSREITESITTLLSDADDEKLRLALKLLKAMVR